ncbi:MAG: hypothetical protein HFE25_04680, partial [Clostridia bacterium]|nr:hypothetical protein [Clostridia bacterium]
MKSTVKNVWAAILAMLAALCLAVGGVLFVQTESRLSANNNRVQAMGAMQSYDETYTLKDGDGKTKTDIWQEVIDAANSNKKLYVVLGENWDLDGDSSYTAVYGINGLSIPANYDITLDLNGNTLCRTLTTTPSGSGQAGNLITISPSASLTVTDKSASQSGMLKGARSPGGGGGVRVEGNFYLYAGTIYDCQSLYNGGGVLVCNGAVFEMHGGTIKDNATGSQGGIGSGVGVLAGGTFTMYGGLITENKSYTGSTTGTGSGTAGNTGAGVGVQGGTFVMKGGSITKNIQTDKAYNNNGGVNAIGGGGGVAAFAGGTFTMEGGLISENKSSYGGAGVSVSSGTFNFKGGKIAANIMYGNLDYPCAVLIFDSVATMTDGEISGHACRGISVQGTTSTVFNFAGGEISGNIATGSPRRGGGIYLGYAATLNMFGGVISGNTADQGGGVFWDYSSSPTNKINIGGPVQITGNTGGNLYLPVSSTANGANTIRLRINGKLIQNGIAAKVGVSLTSYNATSSQLIPFTNNYQYGTNTANNMDLFVGNYFFADDPQYGIVVNTGGEACVATWNTHGCLVKNHKYNYQISLSDGSTYNTISHTGSGANVVSALHSDVAVMLNKLGNAAYPATLDASASRLTYTYGATGIYVTGVKVYHLNDLGGAYQGKTIDMDSSDQSKPFGKYIDSSGNNKTIIGYIDSFGSNGGSTDSYTFTSIGGANRAGYYTFIPGDSMAIVGYRAVNCTFTVEVNPKPVTVTLSNSITAKFGMNDTELLTFLKNGGTTPYYTVAGLVGSDTIELDFQKEYGTDANKTYLLSATPSAASASNNNGNYIITVANTGKLTIVPREVTIILNDDYATYGDSNMKESQVTDSAANNNNALAGNNVISQKENASTKYQDIEGKDVTSDGTTSGTPYYKGGWQYPSTAKAENKFVAATLTGGVSTGAAEFLKYTFEPLTSGTDYAANDTEKYLNVRSASSGSAKAAYTIKVENTNKNYVVKFQDKTGASIGSDDNGEFKFEVREADLGNLKAPSETSTPKVGKYTGAEYNGSAVTIAL